MAIESENQKFEAMDENPVGLLSHPGDQMLCLLIWVKSTPQGLTASPNPATVAMDDRVLWIGEPGLGPFKIGMETDDILEVRAVGSTDANAPGHFLTKGASKDGATEEETKHVWCSGASHIVGGWPKSSVEILRYRLWEADNGKPGDVMTLFISNPRNQVFGTSGTVRPTDPF